MPEYVVGELYAEAMNRIAELEKAITVHRDAHENGTTGTFLVSHVADLSLWAVLENHDD